jgi:hypothetical protein
MALKHSLIALAALAAVGCAKVRVEDADRALAAARAAATRAEDAAAQDPSRAKIAQQILTEAELQRREGADPKTVLTLAERAKAAYEKVLSEASAPSNLAKDQSASQPTVQ